MADRRPSEQILEYVLSYSPYLDEQVRCASGSPTGTPATEARSRAPLPCASLVCRRALLLGMPHAPRVRGGVAMPSLGGRSEFYSPSPPRALLDPPSAPPPLFCLQDIAALEDFDVGRPPVPGRSLR